MKRRHLVLIAAMLAVATGSLEAAADPKGNPGEARKEAKEARKEAKEARKEANEARKDARDAIRDGGAEAIAEARKKLAEAREKLRETRGERRKATAQALKAKYGDDLLKKPAVRAELRLHAHRVAKLERIKRVANASGKAELEKRVDALLAKENARHTARMDRLKANNGEEKE